MSHNRPMSPEESQVVVPPSFVALYLAPGRTRPNAPRGEIAARHEFCDDLATMLVDTASTQLALLGVTEGAVLGRIRRGLLAGDAGVSAAEAEWVVRRLAELLGWPDD